MTDDYTEFPPIKHLMRVLKNCPTSALLYIQLWRTKESRSVLTRLLTIEKKEIRRNYFISPTKFRNLLVPLLSINLVCFLEGDDKFEIDIMGRYLND